MPTFTYTARAVNGELKTATIDAPSREEVVAQLRRQRMSVVKVDEESAKKSKTKGSIKMRDIVIFTRQFSTMINAGLPLVQALDILAKQTENKVLSEVTRAVVFDVESGHTVADALGNNDAAEPAPQKVGLRSGWHIQVGRLKNRAHSKFRDRSAGRSQCVENSSAKLRVLATRYRPAVSQLRQ